MNMRNKELQGRAQVPQVIHPQTPVIHPSSNTSNTPSNTELSDELNGLKYLVKKMSKQLDKLMIRFNEMDDVPQKLRNVKLGHEEWTDNYNIVKVHVEELGSGNKALNIPNLHSPKHLSNTRSLNGFAHKLKFNVPIFKG